MSSQTGPSGLPDASGWLLLIGQPIGLLAVLMVIWGDAVRGGLRQFSGRSTGRLALVACALLGLTGLGAAAARVADARDDSAPFAVATAPVPDTYPRLDRPAPALGLVDQAGAPIDLAALNGRPALVTFAFRLGEDAFVVSAAVDEVNAALDRWGVARQRNEQTGEVAHPPLVYVLDAEGRIAYASTAGGTDALVELLGRS
jgi:cytochrome oxidase Cu insertion factor (SCO1/SenC/PrrC family)